MPTIEDAIKHLNGLYKPTDHVAMAIWTEEDVLGMAKDRGIGIIRERAGEILDEMDRRQDASIGISWDTIDDYLNDYVREHVEGKLRFIELLKQTFESSSTLTPQFSHFYKVFRRDFTVFLRELGIESKITVCSYRRGDYAYLEEDCDAPTFEKAMEKRGRKVEYEDHSSNRESVIRSYEPWDPSLTIQGADAATNPSPGKS